MPKVLVIAGHPDLAASRHNSALVDAARALPDVTVHDLYAAYPDFDIDAEAERELLAAHDVIVFQHPVYWYNAPALLREWQDKVLNYGWAFTYDGTPSQLAGKKAVISVTAGATAEAYTLEGMNQGTIETFLSSWQATLRLCQFEVEPVVALYGTRMGPGVSDDELAVAASQYADMLAAFSK